MRNLGLDVPKKIIAVSIAPWISTEVRPYGVIDGSFDAVEKLLKNNTPRTMSNCAWCRKPSRVVFFTEACHIRVAEAEHLSDDIKHVTEFARGITTCGRKSWNGIFDLPSGQAGLILGGWHMNYKISNRAASLSPSLTLAIDSKAKQMKAEGLDVVGFGAGEPDFDTPQHIKDAAAKSLAEGFTKYTPSSGIPALRQAVADKFKRDQGLSYKPSQIIISCGGKHSCFNVIMATCQEGDEVLIPAPYWLSYPEMVKLAGASPVFLPTTDRTEFKVTPEQLEAAFTARTRLLVLNSPSNPTGTVYTREELKALGDLCVQRGVLIMSDEIYEKLLYDGATHTSMASFSQAHYDHTIVVHGLAKAYSMTGWRLGFLAAPQPIAQAIDAIQSHSTSNPTSFAQQGGVAALTGPQDHLPGWLAEYSKRRSYAYKRLNSMPGVSCVNAKGAFYLFPNIAGCGLKSTEFCARLLEEENVAAVPGIAFGADDYLRISYATSLENIAKGLDRMERFVRRLAGSGEGGGRA